MRFEYSPDVRALYVHLAAGEVAKTVELDLEIMADLDASGRLLGVEFLDAHEFFPFLARYAPSDDQTVYLIEFPAILETAVRNSRAASAA